MQVLLTGTLREWMQFVEEDYRYYTEGKKKEKLYIEEITRARKSELIKVFDRIKKHRKLYKSSVWRLDEDESSGSDSV